MNRIAAVVLSCLAITPCARAVRELVVLEEPQPAQRVQGIVVDVSGAPIPGMTVTDCTNQWAKALRSAKTDAEGRFHFSQQLGKSLYYLRFDHPGFNPLELQLKLDKHSANQSIRVCAPIGG